MDHCDLEKRVAYLESVNDQLASEIRYVDKLLRSIGFPEGLATVKSAARELMDTGYEEEAEAEAEGYIEDYGDEF